MVAAVRGGGISRASDEFFALPVLLQGSLRWFRFVLCRVLSTPRFTSLKIRYCGSWMSSFGGLDLVLVVVQLLV